MENKTWQPLGNAVFMAATKAHCLQTDAMLLADFAFPKRGERVADLGTGCGIMPLLWFRDSAWNGTVTGVEWQSTAAELASESIARNGLQERFTVVNADWRSLPVEERQRYHRVVCNPPYFAPGSGSISESQAEVLARHEQADTLSSVCEAADFLLRYGGVFCMCHRPERLTDVLMAMKTQKLEPKRLQMVQQRADAPPWLVMIEAKKGGKSGLMVLPPLLMTEDGQPSREINRIYAAMRQTEQEGQPIAEKIEEQPFGDKRTGVENTMAGRLTLVGTPIGNLSDMSPRAVDALRECDFIAAEDTRVTLKLLNHFDIKKPMVSYYEQNKRERGGQIAERLLQGENGVLVSDAGMPAISDPGEDLVALCHNRGISVGVVPGPSAVVTALAVSGMPSGRFTFEGFLSMNKRSRREHLSQLVNEPRTMIFYEAPHKLASTLEDMLQAWGDRPLALVRELTKIHEEVIQSTLAQAAVHYRTEPARGEFVLIIGGAAPKQAAVFTPEEAVELANELIESEGLSVSDAAKRAAAQTGLKKGEIYKLLVQ